MEVAEPVTPEKNESACEHYPLKTQEEKCQLVTRTEPEQKYQLKSLVVQDVGKEIALGLLLWTLEVRLAQLDWHQAAESSFNSESRV